MVGQSLREAAAEDFSGRDVTHTVGIFLPPAEDSSNIVVNTLVNRLMQETETINVVLFLVDQLRDERIFNSPFLHRRYVLHSELLSEVVFPFLEERGLQSNPEGILLSPNLLAQKFGDRVSVERVADPNSFDFVRRVAQDSSLKLGFSVRNLVIFQEPLIQAFVQKSANSLINLHPAKLPGIRGLDGPFWTRVEGKTHYATTMHVIDEGIDTGPTLDFVFKAVNGQADKAITAYMRDVAPEVADMIFHEITLRLVAQAVRSPVEHDKDESIYRSLPTDDDIMRAEDEGINLDSKKAQLAFLLRAFTNPDENATHHEDLMGALHDYYAEYRQKRERGDFPYGVFPPADDTWRPPAKPAGVSEAHLEKSHP